MMAEEKSGTFEETGTDYQTITKPYIEKYGPSVRVIFTLKYSQTSILVDL
jgi:hypothetical protein